MKLKVLVARSFIVGVMAFAAVACREFDRPERVIDEMPPNITIAELSRLVGDKSLTIDQPLRIGGVVTSSDAESNFHKTFTIEDATAGVEIMAGIYGLHNIYPQGHYLTVDLDGCGVGRHYGVLQVGLPAKSYSGYPTDYFSSRVLLDRHISCHQNTATIEPQRLRPADLDTSMCGRLVQIDNLQLCSYLHPEAWEVNLEGTWHGYNFFSTAEDGIVVVYTSDYASYADEPIPQGKLSITGILQHGVVAGEELFMIKMRSESDCRQNEI